MHESANTITQIFFGFFDAYPSWEIRGVFLDLSKHLIDKVWHNGLRYKLQNNGTDSNLLCLIKFFLYHRHQRAIPNGQYSIWKLITAGEPQGFGNGSLFFPVYISGVLQGLKSDFKLIADDTLLFSVVSCGNASVSTLNNDLMVIKDWG